jgi:hypothetical protein
VLATSKPLSASPRPHPALPTIVEARCSCCSRDLRHCGNRARLQNRMALVDQKRGHALAGPRSADSSTLVAAIRMTKSAWSAWHEVLGAVDYEVLPLRTRWFHAAQVEPAPGSLIAKQSTRSPRTLGSK